jgi:hypothetical protein
MPVYPYANCLPVWWLFLPLPIPLETLILPFPLHVFCFGEWYKKFCMVSVSRNDMKQNSAYFLFREMIRNEILLALLFHETKQSLECFLFRETCKILLNKYCPFRIIPLFHEINFLPKTRNPCGGGVDYWYAGPGPFFQLFKQQIITVHPSRRCIYERTLYSIEFGFLYSKNFNELLLNIGRTRAVQRPNVVFYSHCLRWWQWWVFWQSCCRRREAWLFHRPWRRRRPSRPHLSVAAGVLPSRPPQRSRQRRMPAAGGKNTKRPLLSED